MQSTGQSIFSPNSTSTLATRHAHDTSFPHNLTVGPAPPLMPGQFFPAHKLRQAASRLPSAPGKVPCSRQASLRPALRQRVSSSATTISSGSDYRRIVPSACHRCLQSGLPSAGTRSPPSSRGFETRRHVEPSPPSCSGAISQSLSLIHPPAIRSGQIQHQ